MTKFETKPLPEIQPLKRVPGASPQATQIGSWESEIPNRRQVHTRIFELNGQFSQAPEAVFIGRANAGHAARRAGRHERVASRRRL